VRPFTVLVCPYAKTSLVIRKEIANVKRGCETGEENWSGIVSKHQGGEIRVFLERLLRRRTKSKTRWLN